MIKLDDLNWIDPKDVQLLRVYPDLPHKGASYVALFTADRVFAWSYCHSATQQHGCQIQVEGGLDYTLLFARHSDQPLFAAVELASLIAEVINTNLASPSSLQLNIGTNAP